MAKFPTEVEQTITVPVPLDRAHAFFSDIVGSARCIPGIDRCEKVGEDTYRFIYQERSTGPVSMVVRYTAHYQGNGRDEIHYHGVAAAEDNTDIAGTIQLAPVSAGETRVTVRQTVAPETPVSRLLQGVLRSFVQREAEGAVAEYLAAVKRTLAGAS